MRLFIAIELSPAVRRELTGMLKAVRERSCGGRFVPPESLHVTMRFLGDTDDLAGAVEAMRRAVRGIRPFALAPEKYGFIDGREGGRRTAVVFMRGDDEILVLRETLEAALADRGFIADRKRFRPHVTMGRSVEQDEIAAAELMQTCFASSMTVTGITLFESTREKGRPVYLPLHREEF